jgi:hypothetical protein
MKTTHKSIIGIALVAAVSFIALAADKPAPKERVIRIHSNGQTIAEVHLLTPGKLKFEGLRTVSPSGDATVRPLRQNELAGGVVMFDSGHVLKFETSAEYSGKAVDFELPSK